MTDERRWTLEGGIRTGHGPSFQDTLVSGPAIDLGASVEVRPASQVAHLKECLAKASDEWQHALDRWGESEERVTALRDEVERLRAECARCETCGHVQGEPNWCHRCGRRTRFPEWASEREAEVARLTARVEELEAEGLRLAGLLDPTFAEGVEQERRRVSLRIAQLEIRRVVTGDREDGWNAALEALAAVLEEEGPRIVPPPPFDLDPAELMRRRRAEPSFGVADPRAEEEMARRTDEAVAAEEGASTDGD